MLSLLSSVNYKAWFAFAEFIDNSIQSYLANRATLHMVHPLGFQLKIEVILDHANNRVIIRDNAAGIDSSEFGRAFQPGNAPIERSGLSEFGMGMKSAACWFAKKWCVRTKALGENVARTVSFDLATIIATNSEDIDVLEGASDINNHFTEIILEDLQHQVRTRTLSKCKEYLASIYRRFIDDGTVKLFFDSEELIYKYPEVLVEPEWHGEGIIPPEGSAQIKWLKNLDFTFGGGRYRATGIAAIRKEASTTTNGMSLLRRRRLIVGTDGEPYRPAIIYGQPNSYESQRVFIELEINAAVSHTKDGFRLDSAEEDEFLQTLRKKLNEEPVRLIRMANNYRPLKRAKSEKDKVSVQTVTDSTTRAIVGPVRVEIEDQLTTPVGQEGTIPLDLPSSDFIANERRVELEFEGLTWVITIELNSDPSQSDLIDVAENSAPDTRSITIRLALAHPYVRKNLGLNYENLEAIYHLATALGISEVTSRLGGLDNQAGRMRVFFGRILQKLCEVENVCLS